MNGLADFFEHEQVRIKHPIRLLQLIAFSFKIIFVIKNNDYEKAADAFMLWAPQMQEKLPGLKIRRKAERDLFKKGM